MDRLVRAYRFFCLQSHYRKSLVFTWENLDNATVAYNKLLTRIAALKDEGEVDQAAFDEYKAKFTAAMDNDLNTSMAVTVLYDVLKAKTNDKTKLALLDSFDTVLGLKLLEKAAQLRSKQAAAAPAAGEFTVISESGEADGAVEALIRARADAKKAKKLIEESGITPGAITLRTTDNEQIKGMAAQVKNDLDALGFDVTIQTDTSPATYAAIDGGEAYDILLAPGDPSCFGADPDLLLNWWYGDNVWTRARSRWATTPAFAEVAELLAEARRGRRAAEEVERVLRHHCRQRRSVPRCPRQDRLRFLGRSVHCAQRRGPRWLQGHRHDEHVLQGRRDRQGVRLA